MINERVLGECKAEHSVELQAKMLKSEPPPKNPINSALGHFKQTS